MNRTIEILVTVAIGFFVITCSEIAALAQSSTRISSATQESDVYSCPTHTDVRSKVSGKCPKCGLTLLRKPPGSVGEYRVVLKTMPAVVKPGRKVKLNFTIFEPKTGARVKNFNVVHEKAFHLFLVSQDLEHFEHIYPVQQTDGSFIVNIFLPKEGSYQAYFDFFPVGGTPQIIRKSLVTAGFNKATSSKANIVPDQDLTKSVDGIRFELSTEPSDLISGKSTHLSYHLVHDNTDQPVTDLQPYLGAWGYTVVLSEDTSEALHTYPERMIGEGVDRSTLISEPEISFGAFFGRPGRYRIWSQFQRQDKVTTVSFSVNVVLLDKVAKWDGRSWAGLPGTSSAELNRTVFTVTSAGRDVYVGGDFTSIGGIRANRIAKWDGRTWSALGDGIDNGIVYAIAVTGTGVYVGGSFTAASGIRVNRIAKWDGQGWSPLSSGVNGCKDPYCSPTVYAISATGTDLYVGGQFTSAGEITANGIAKWNGRRWSSVASGMRTGSRDGVVMALAVSGKDLYAGGRFITAGEADAHNVARWNGTNWSSMGGGIRGRMEKVRTIAIGGSNVYVGGSFSTAGGVNAQSIAKWNGSSWSSIGIDPEDVYAIAVTEKEVYVSGSSFTIPGETIMRSIVKWDGKSWSTLGKGIALAPVLGIRLNGQHVYVGGG